MGAVTAISGRQTRRLAGNQLDDLAGTLVKVADQDIDAVQEIVVKRHAEDRDGKSKRRRDERQANSMSEGLAPRGAESAAERVKRLDDADDGSQQAEQGAESRHRAQDPEIALELDDLARAIVAHDLADAQPLADPMS